jgi:hypothetical protein
MPKPPLTGIHVPEDYDQQDNSNMNNQKVSINNKHIVYFESIKWDKFKYLL